ncbi:MAG: cobalt ECF transporter T component CbiQ [Deltaproteobacteria bacterium]|nr:cobalt ECF transporter T component CbiQ [Deltaproteobacteria bacterium]
MASVKLPDWFKEASGRPCAKGDSFATPGFLEKNMENIASFMRDAVASEEYASRPGALQSLTPKARIGGMLALVAACSLTAHILVLAGALLMVAAATIVSGVGFYALIKRVLPSLIFTAALVAPVFFSFITPGTDIFDFAISGVKVSVTREGLSVGFFLIMRVGVMVALISLLLLTTRQTDFFKGLRDLHVPSFFVTALYMTFRYIFILVKTVEDATFARKSRTITRTGLKESQRWAASRITLLLKKSLNMAEEVNMAMASRGFTGRIKSFKSPSMRKRDYLWLFFTIFFLFLSFGV